MNSALSRESISLFESIKQYDENGNEYWTSRDLSRILEYTDYRNFLKVIDKAKIACTNSNQQIPDHFVDFNDMIPIGKDFAVKTSKAKPKPIAPIIKLEPRCDRPSRNLVVQCPKTSLWPKASR